MPKTSSGFATPLVSPNPFPGFVAQQGGPYVCSGLPVGGTSAVQTITIGGTPTGGTFTLTFGGLTTGSIAWSATDATLAANIAAGLNALSNVGAAGVAGSVGSGSSGIGTYLVTFQNQNADLSVPTITVGSNNMSGTSPTVAVATTTTGVTSNLRGAIVGTQVADYSNVVEYTNTGLGTFVRSDSFFARVPLIATTSTSGGGAGSWQPIEGGIFVVTRVHVIVATGSTGAANLSVGVGATATTSATNLIGATSITTGVTNIFSETTSAVPQYAAAGKFVTFTASATLAGLVATAFIFYYKPV